MYFKTYQKYRICVTEKDRLVAEETERCVKEVKTLREQVSKLEADLKYTKVSFWIAYLLYNTTTITTTKQIFTELGSE